MHWNHLILYAWWFQISSISMISWNLRNVLRSPGRTKYMPTILDEEKLYQNLKNLSHNINIYAKKYNIYYYICLKKKNLQQILKLEADASGDMGSIIPFKFVQEKTNQLLYLCL